MNYYMRRLRQAEQYRRAYVGQITGLPGLPPAESPQPQPQPSPGFGVPGAAVPPKEESMSLALAALAGLAAVVLYLQLAKRPFAFLGAR